MSDQAHSTPASGSEAVKSVVGELSAMEYAGDVKAVGIVIVDRDGDLRTLIAWNEGTKLPLLAGLSVMQHNMIGDMAPKQKPRDI